MIAVTAGEESGGDGLVQAEVERYTDRLGIDDRFNINNIPENRILRFPRIRTYHESMEQSISVHSRQLL